MPKVITEEKTVYTYEELSDEAKQEVVDNYLDHYFSSFRTSDGTIIKSDGEADLIELGEPILRFSPFRRATVDGVYYDFSYTQGSGCILEFSYKDNEFGNDFHDIGSQLIDMLTTDESWKHTHNLEDAEIEELINQFRTKSIDELFDIQFSVVHTGRYANYEINFNTHSYLNQEIRYCAEDLLDTYIYEHFINDDSMVDELEGEFESEAKEWYEKMRDINNYSAYEEFFEMYFYENGKFAGYEGDFDD